MSAFPGNLPIPFEIATGPGGAPVVVQNFDLETRYRPIVGDRAIELGQDALADVLVATNLEAAFRERRLTEPQYRRGLTRLVMSGITEVRAIARLLLDGGSTLTGWFRAMLRTITARGWAAAMLGLRTPDPVPADRVAVAAAVAGQVGFLANFREQIRRGAQRLDGGILARSELYAAAVWGVAENVRRAARWRDGFHEERRVRGLADSCRDCVDWALLGWQNIGTLPRIGASICQSRCHCWFETR